MVMLIGGLVETLANMKLDLDILAYTEAVIRNVVYVVTCYALVLMQYLYIPTNKCSMLCIIYTH